MLNDRIFKFKLQKYTKKRFYYFIFSKNYFFWKKYAHQPMKKIFAELKEHVKSDFTPFSYIYTFVFTFSALALNFTLGINKYMSSNYFGKPIGYLMYPLFYFASYYLVLIPILISKNKLFLLKKSEFWVKSLVLLAVWGISASFNEYKDFAQAISSTAFEFSYIKKLFAYSKQFLPQFFILFILKQIYDRKEKGFYGINFGKFNYKPYFLLLLLTVPLVAAASFLPDFQQYYPRLKYWVFVEGFGLSPVQLGAIYETVYALSFVGTELFFRGALVVAMGKILGKEVILAMAATYCFIHFGKPLGEAISSFFGGYILGVIALNHKNINGGIIIHLGIAMLMELTAMAQHLSNS